MSDEKGNLPAWEEYEREVFEELKSRYKDATVTHDARLPGRHSKTERQIDILIEQHVADAPIRIIVDTKHFNRPVDVTGIEAFIAMMKDVEAHQGILISLNGYSEAALQRAMNDTTDVELEVFSLAELKKWQAYAGIPYAGKYAVFLRAPFGWVVDLDGRGIGLALLVERGRDVDSSIDAWDWAYVSIWNREDAQAPDLDSLCRLQDGGLLDKPGAEITYVSSAARKDAVTRIRRAAVPQYKGLEITGFVEFKEFIFFCVFHCDAVREKMTLRKLRGILRQVVPIYIKNAPILRPGQPAPPTA